MQLSELITVDTAFECKVTVFIVGSLGSVHRRVVPDLKLLGFRTKQINRQVYEHN